MPKVKSKKTGEVFNVFRWKDDLSINDMPSWIRSEFTKGNVKILNNGSGDLAEVKSDNEGGRMIANPGNIIAYSESSRLFFTATLEYMEKNYEKLKG